ncbi:MAG: YdcF family protein [Lentimicrobium sp.]
MTGRFINRNRIFYSGFFLIFILLSVTTCRNAGTWLIKKDTPVCAEALVILMGSIPDRVLEASDIYKAGLTDRVVIVEESMGAYRELEARGVRIISNTQQCRNAAIQLGVPSENIVVLPGDARSTQHEVMIVREYLKVWPGIDTILLVTSSDHTRRASMLFEKAFEKSGMQIVVYTCPSKYSNFKGEGWWKQKESIQVVLFEYIKIANFLFIEKYRL